jgi:hypothetical protein
VTEGLTKFGPPAESHIQMVMQEYNLTRSELTGPSKEHRLMPARRDLFMRLLCTPWKWVNGEPVYRSLPKASRYVGDRDHTTGLSSIRAYGVEFLDLPWKSSVAEIRVAYIAKSQQAEGMEIAA